MLVSVTRLHNTKLFIVIKNVVGVCLCMENHAKFQAVELRGEIPPSYTILS